MEFDLNVKRLGLVKEIAHSASRVERRTFIGTLASALLAVTGEIGAQPTGKLYRIGYLNAGAKTPAGSFHAFPDALRELRWIEETTFVPS